MDTIDTAAMALSAPWCCSASSSSASSKCSPATLHGAAPLTNEASQVVATPAVDPALRTGLVVLGLVVLLLWGLYRLAAPGTTDEDVASDETQQADVQSD